MLAHKVFDPATVTAIVKGANEVPLEPGERAMMAFIEKLVRNAHEVTRADVEALRSHGYRDEEIFDVAAAGAARCFFSKLLDALGRSRIRASTTSTRRCVRPSRWEGPLPISRYRGSLELDREVFS